MTLAEDAAAVRDAVSTADACTAQTVAQLKDILGYSSSKEPADAATRPTASRPIPKSKMSSAQLDARQRHNLATDIFNSSIKTLSGLVRRDASANPGSKSVKALRVIPNPPAVKNGVDSQLSKTAQDTTPSPRGGMSVAECAVIACHYLSQSNVAKTRTSYTTFQLESGIIALTAKLIHIGFDKHAIRLLSLVKKALESPQHEAPAKETLSSLLNVPSAENDAPERSELLASYFTLILQVMTGPAYAVSVSHALLRLDPNDSQSPCAATLRFTDPVKAARLLETQAQAMVLITTNAGISPLTRLKLHSFAMQTRQLCPLPAHSIDLDLEQYIFLPLLGILGMFAQSSKEPPAQIYKTAAAVYDQILSRCQQQGDEISRIKLLRYMESLAPTEIDKAKWTHQIASANGTPQPIADCLANLAAMSSRIDLLVVKNQSLQRDLLSQCGQSLDKAFSQSAPEHLAELAPPIIGLRKTTTNALQKATKGARADRLLLAETVFMCVKTMHSLATAPSFDQQVLTPHMITRVIDSAMYAAGQCLTVLDVDPQVIFDPTRQCIDMLAKIDLQENEKTVLQLSNVLWLAFQKLSKTGHTPDRTKYLVSSLKVLHDATTPIKQAGLYLPKLERLAELQVRDGDAAKSYETLAIAIKHHISSTGVLGILVEVNSLSLSSKTSNDKDIFYLRRLLRLQLDVMERGRLESGLFDDEALTPAERRALIETHLNIGISTLAEAQGRPSAQLRAVLNASITRLLSLYDLMSASRLDLHHIVQVLRLYDSDLVAHALVGQAATDIADGSNTDLFIRCLDALVSGQICDEFDMQITSWAMTAQDAKDDRFLLRFTLEAVHARVALLDDQLRAYKISTILQVALTKQKDRGGELRGLSRTCHAALALGLSSTALECIDKGQQLLKSTTSDFDQFDQMGHHLEALDTFTCIGDYDRAQAAFAAFHAASVSATPRKTDKSRFYAYQARAGCLYSNLARKTGHIASSLHYGKESIRLYKSLISAIEKQKPAPQDQSTVSVDGLTDRVAGLALADAKFQTMPSINDPERHAIQLQLLDVYCYMSDVHLDQGLRIEADYFLDKAKGLKIAPSVPSCQLRLACLELRMATLSGTPGGQSDMEQSAALPLSSSLPSIRYHIARGDALLKTDAEAASQAFSKAETLLQDLTSITSASAGVETNHVHATTIAKPAVRASKTKSQAKAAMPASRTTKSKASAPQPSLVNTHAMLEEIMASIKCRQALARLEAGRVEDADAIVSSLTASSDTHEAGIRAQLVRVRVNLAKVNEQLAVDVKYNTIPEATIPLPSLATSAPDPSTELVKSTKGKKAQDACKVASLLRDTAQSTVRTMSSAITRLALDTGYQSCSLAMTATMLLSAMGRPVGVELHPVKAARTFQIPQIDASQRQITAEAVDTSRASLQDLLKHAAAMPRPSVVPLLSTAEYQRDYVDILPKSWTVVSIGLNEELDELRLARLGCQQTPFVLRLPLSRQSGNDMDDDVGFDFETGRNELRDIIECSNFSCHSSIDLAVKGSKTKWWNEREALDRRLHELLVNIENIWLGGFKGMFSLHQRRADLLARFRKSFDNILDRHLPSRSGSGSTKTAKKPVLDSNILELFIGLGNVSRQEPGELEEQVLDLLHFVLDTLSFNGEANAYDEVDVDGMAIDTLEAMRSYSEADTGLVDKRHLILVLDKKLHNFPWESLSCLHGQSVSRVGSMLHVRERLLSMRRRHDAERAIVSSRKGTYVVNPSGDLAKTQKLLEPALSPLLKATDGEASAVGWKAISGRAPAGDEFAQSLSDSDVFLYFGHGSGNQYISNRSVRKLQRAAQVVWLMGCSSGQVTENGDLEPYSVPLSYLVAGESVELAHVGAVRAKDDGRVDSAHGSEEDPVSDQQHRGRDGVCMAVLATLWDVTDKDIDRFSIRVGQEWGLFAEDESEPIVDAGRQTLMSSAAASAPKTTDRKTTKGSAPKTPAPRGAKTPSAAPTAAATAKTPRAAKTPRTTRGKQSLEDESNEDLDLDRTGAKTGLVEKDRNLSMAVAQSREACYLRYLNGAAPVVYGVPVYLGD